MPAAIVLRTDYSASELRRLAKSSRANNQSRRLLSLVAVPDGMDRQAPRDWSHRFNEFGPEGLVDRHGGGVAEAWAKPAALPDVIKSIGTSKWAHVDRCK
jgi:hypothetical protein